MFCRLSSPSRLPIWSSSIVLLRVFQTASCRVTSVQNCAKYNVVLWLPNAWHQPKWREEVVETIQSAVLKSVRRAIYGSSRTNTSLSNVSHREPLSRSISFMIQCRPSFIVFVRVIACLSTLFPVVASSLYLFDPWRTAFDIISTLRPWFFSRNSWGVVFRSNSNSDGQCHHF